MPKNVLSKIINNFHKKCTQTSLIYKDLKLKPKNNSELPYCSITSFVPLKLSKHQIISLNFLDKSEL